MDRKAWFIDFAKIAGRKNLRKYFISVVKSILCNHDNSDEETLLEILNAMEGLNEALSDESLPWEVEGMKKASAPTEAPREISQLDCNINLAKVEPLVDRVWAEETMRSVENA